MTDLATTPGAEEARPEDDAPIVDPAASDADVDLTDGEPVGTDDDEAPEAIADGETDAEDESEGEGEPEDQVSTEDDPEDDVEVEPEVSLEDDSADHVSEEDDPEAADDVSEEDDVEPEDENHVETEPEDEVSLEDETEDDAAEETEPEAETADDAAVETEAEPENDVETEAETADDVEDDEADAEDEPEAETADDAAVEDAGATEADAEDEPEADAVDEDTVSVPEDAEDDVEAEADAEDEPEGETADDAAVEDAGATEADAEDEPEADAAVAEDETIDEAEPAEDDADIDAEATQLEDDTDLEDETDADATELVDEDATSIEESALLDSPADIDAPADLVELDTDTDADEHELADQATLVGAAVAASAAGATPTATAVLSAPAAAPTTPQVVPTGTPLPTGPDGSMYAWAPVEPQPRKSRKAMWIGVGAGAAAIGLVVASIVLIAPGTSIAGVPVGFLTSAAATEAVQHRLATTTIVLTGAGGDAEVTGADLGASVDARGLAEAAYAEHPLWNVTAWFPASADAPVRIDEQVANSALRAVAPELYVDPVDATLAFDASSVSYVTTPAEAGEGIDVEAVRKALQDAFESGQSRVELEATIAPVQATTPTYVAEASAAQLNSILDHAGFYVGTERTVPVDRAVAASWLTVTPGERGTFAIAADESAIGEVVATLPEAVDRETVHATVVTDSDGEVLQEIAEGVTGRTLGDTGDVASDYAAQLASGDPRFELPVEETPFTTTTLERRIEVDLGSQVTYLYENDKVIGSYAISSGLPGTPTFTGSYRVFAHTAMQDMGCFEDAPYCTENVPWITWFNGDQAFHGTYWHNNFGNRMSHGCVNLPIDLAKFVYDWAPVGTEVWVHA